MANPAFQTNLRQTQVTGSLPVTFTNVTSMLIYNSGLISGTIVAQVALDNDLPLPAGSSFSLPSNAPNVYATIVLNANGGTLNVYWV